MTPLSSTVARIKLWSGFFARIAFPRDLPLVLQAFRRRRRFSIPDDTWAMVDSIGGFLSIKEAGLLHWAACEWPAAGPVVELGSYQGRSTIVFACAGRTVHAVDAWSLQVDDLSAFGRGDISAEDVFQRFHANVKRAGVEARVHVHRGLTCDVGRQWTVPGAILFVDAGHTYADVIRDLATWTPHLAERGLLIMHDVLGDVYLDVTRAASELLRQDWRVVASAGSAVAFARR